MESYDLQRLLQPYEKLALSAYDNLKLIRALLSDQGESCDCLTLPRIREENEVRDGYFIRWQGVWIDCGWTNDYSARIELVAPPSEQAQLAASVVSVPTLSLQQVSFMCMQYSHFDHC